MTETRNLVFATGTPVNIRDMPTVKGRLLAQATYQDMGYATAFSAPDSDGYPWVNVTFTHGQVAGQVGWVRSDLLNVVGDFTVYGGGFYSSITNLDSALIAASDTSTSVLSKESLDKWPPPVANYTITQGYGGPTGHKGIDLAGAVGTPVYAYGPGIVWAAVLCTKCVKGDGSLNAQGITNPETTFNDIGYGYGYGNYVITRHRYTDLPKNFQTELDAIGLFNGYVFVLLGHLQSLSIMQSAQVIAGTELGKRGTTGNSSGPHVHLQIMASVSANPANIFNELLIDPTKLFTL